MQNKFISLLASCLFILLGVTSCEDPMPSVSSISLETDLVQLTEGETITLNVKVLPETYKGELQVGYGSDVTSESLQTASIIASCSNGTCTIKALHKGVIKFYLYAEDVKSSACVVVVSEKPSTDPNQPGTDPNQPGTDPNQPGIDPNQPDQDPINPEPTPEPTPDLAINPASITIEVAKPGDSALIFVEAINADTTVVWAIDQPADSVLSGIEDPSNNKRFYLVGIQTGTATVVAWCGDKVAKCEVTVIEGEAPSNLPELEAPAANQVTICVLVPDGTVDCGGVGCTGAGADEFTADGRTKWNPGACVPFTPVDEILGTVEYGDWENWWAVTLTSSDFSTLQTKVIGLAADPTTTGWGNQWGKNEGDVVIIDGPGDLGEGTEPQLQNLEGGTIVYIAIQDWQNGPCIPKNPAGEADFNLKATNLPAEAKFITICGNWDSESEYTAWLPGSGPVFEQNAEVPTSWFALNVPVPADFQYKYVWSADGVTWDWDHAQESFDNIPMDVDLLPIDEIDAWRGGATPEPPFDVW